MRPGPTVYVTILVVGTIALVTLVYSGTLATCAIFKIEPSPEILGALKDTGLVALGALGSMLARTGHTGSGEGVPVETVITNTRAQPIPTKEEVKA